MTITFGSVCSGIEAASVAWHIFGWRAAWLAEIEPFPAKVLHHHYGSGRPHHMPSPDDAGLSAEDIKDRRAALKAVSGLPVVPLVGDAPPNLGDMTKIAALIRAEAIPAPDVLVGGTPCQAFSIAGLRNSLDDARGQLSLSFVDLANAIDSVRLVRGEPESIVVWENVPGVLTTKDNAFGCFLAALAGEDEPLQPSGGRWTNAGCVLGPQRTIAWRVTDAQYFGVAQRRRRVFVVASAREGFNPTEVLFEFDGVRRDIAPSRDEGKETPPTTGRSFNVGSHWDGNYPHPTLNQSHNVGGVGQSNQEIFSQRGAYLVPDTPEPPVCAARMVAFGEYVDDGTASTMKQRDYKDATDLVAYALQSTIIGRQDPLSSTEVFGALGSSSPQAQAVAFVQNSRDEVRLMGGDGQIVGALAAETGAKQQCYVAQPASHTPFDVAGTMLSRAQSGGFSNSIDHAASGYMCLSSNMAVRRLTPRECERLQAFPDDYTLIPGKPLAHVDPAKLDMDYIKYLMRGGVLTFEQCCIAAADGPRYKALGNSMCVFNMRWIGQRIDAVISPTKE